MISLCSKSYIIKNEEGKQKISCKGVSKKALTNAMEIFEVTLMSKNVISSKNISFRINKSVIQTYSQEKIGFYGTSGYHGVTMGRKNCTFR